MSGIPLAIATFTSRRSAQIREWMAAQSATAGSDVRQSPHMQLQLRSVCMVLEFVEALVRQCSSGNAAAVFFPSPKYGLIAVLRLYQPHFSAA